ncbi:DUF3108 domain-containing protein [Candidatus Poribacteria bacterium]|nr:DUF3108 domain-containing protein [Candidatus Poribacteria bacterium]
MLRNRLAAAVLALLLSTASAAGWRLPQTETLHYTVRWVRIGVVDATMSLSPPTVIDGVPIQRLRVEARTRALPSRIYRVTNRYETDIDTRTGLPVAYRSDIDEAKFQERLDIRYAQRERTADYRRTEADRSTRQALPGETHTIFSALYRIRLHDFGSEPRLRFLLDAKGIYWRAEATRTDARRVSGGVVWDVETRFERLPGGSQSRQSDLLTDNLVVEGSPLRLRILSRSDAPPLVTRMEYSAKGFRLSAELDGY